MLAVIQVLMLTLTITYLVMSQVVTLKKNWKEKENFEMEARKYGQKG